LEKQPKKQMRSYLRQNQVSEKMTAELNDRSLEQVILVSFKT